VVRREGEIRDAIRIVIARGYIRDTTHVIEVEGISPHLDAAHRAAAAIGAAARRGGGRARECGRRAERGDGTERRAEREAFVHRYSSEWFA